MDSHGAGGCNVDFAVVDEEAIGRGNIETAHAVLIDRRVWLARAPACLPFVQRDDALPSGMRRIDAAIRRDMRDRLDSRGNLHLRPQDRLRGRNSDFGMPALLPAFDRLVDASHHEATGPS